MEVVPVRIQASNYSYLLIDKENQVGAVVDVGYDASAIETVYPRAKELGVKITTILTTHSHGDHCGGNEALAAKIETDEDRRVAIVGGVGENVPGVTQEVSDNDIVKVGNLRVRVFLVPSHTPGHVFYYCNDVLFTGDILSVGSCGPLFQGSPEQMHYAVNEVVAKLPPTTKIYCGHEFTYANLLFAQHVEPNNEAIANKLAWVKDQVDRKLFTVPTTVADELATNPFMRLDEPAVLKFVGDSCANDPAAALAALRTAKPAFLESIAEDKSLSQQDCRYS